MEYISLLNDLYIDDQMCYTIGNRQGVYKFCSEIKK